MPLVYDPGRFGGRGGGAWVEWDDVNTWPDELARRDAQALEALRRSQGRWKTADKFAWAATAVPFAAAAPAIIGGVAGAGSGGAAVGGASAGAGGLAPIAGGSPWAITPYASTAAMTGTGAGVTGTGASILTSLLKNPDTYRTIGSLVSGGAQGAAAERGNANRYRDEANRNVLSRYGIQQNALLSSLLAASNEATSRYGTQQSATTNALNSQSAEGLQRAQLGLQAPSVRARQAVLGSLMKNLQPTRVQAAPGQRGHETTITGGLSAAALDPTTRQHGEALMRAALEAQLSGSDVPAATDFQSGVLTPPAATDYSKGLVTPPELAGYRDPGTGESLMSGVGIGANILGEILRLIRASKSGGEPPMGAG